MKHFIGDFCPAKACNFRRRKIPPAFTEIIPRHQGNHAPLRRKISPAFAETIPRPFGNNTPLRRKASPAFVTSTKDSVRLFVNKTDIFLHHDTKTLLPIFR